MRTLDALPLAVCLVGACGTGKYDVASVAGCYVLRAAAVSDSLDPVAFGATTFEVAASLPPVFELATDSMERRDGATWYKVTPQLVPGLTDSLQASAWRLVGDSITVQWSNGIDGLAIRFRPRRRDPLMATASIIHSSMSGPIPILDIRLQRIDRCRTYELRPAPAWRRRDRADDDRLVYEATVDTLLFSAGGGALVLLDTLLHTWPPATIVVLPADLRLPQEIRRIAGDDLAAIRDPMTYWEAFAREYPGAEGLLELGEVEYGGTDVAKVHYRRDCGILCGTDGYVYLTRRERRWQPDSIVVHLIS